MFVANTPFLKLPSVVAIDSRAQMLNHAVVGHAAQNRVVGLGEATQVAQRPRAESPLHVCVRSRARRVRAHDLVVTARPEESEEPLEVFAEALLAADEDKFPAEFGALQREPFLVTMWPDVCGP